MPKLVKSWPYAGASTGRYRGRLEGKLECWDANGPARVIFNNEIHIKIKDYILNNLPESSSFIGFSLFMVGRTQLRTSPTVLIVSDDKPRRKAAFEGVRSSGILEQYPGFHVAHCRLAAEFEDLQPMARRKGKATMTMTQRRFHTPSTDCGIYISSLADRAGDPLFVHDHASGALGGSQATIGCLLAQNDGLSGVAFLYGVTVAHVLPGHAAPFKSTRSDEDCHSSCSNTPDFETTAMDDLDEDSDPELCSITSEESISLADDMSYLASSSHPSPANASKPVPMDDLEAEETLLPLETAQSDFLWLESPRPRPIQCDSPDNCKGAVAVVHTASDLDLMLLAVDARSQISFPACLMSMSLFAESADISIDDDIEITVRLLHRAPVAGRLSATAFHAQYGTLGFQKLYLAKITTPLCPGDCGSWAYAGMPEGGEKMVGIVVAGSPSTGSVLILPGQTVLDYVRRHLGVGSKEDLAKEELFSICLDT